MAKVKNHTVALLALVAAIPQGQASGFASSSRRANNLQRRQRGGVGKDSTGGSKKTSGSKKSKGKGLSFCDNCAFSLKYDGIAGFQVINGEILSSDQIASAPDDIAICDSCKCTATNSNVVIASIEGECDPYQTVDVLEFTATSIDEADINLVCPDVTYIASAACQTFTLPPDGGPRIPNTPTNFGIDIILEGPLVLVQLNEPGLYLDCTMVCTNPNPPPPGKGSKGKGKSKSKKNPSLKYYDPFADKFPL